jgi:hypothetical protein
MKVTVMPNKDMVYFSARLALRRQGVTHLAEEKLSAEEIIFRKIEENKVGRSIAYPLIYNKKVKRQHGLLKNKRLCQFMETVNESNKWIAQDSGDKIILIPQ